MILTEFDHNEFLRTYWQREPLLIKHKGEAFVDPIDADELAGLACEHSIESRIVTHIPDNDWQVRHGPFNAAVFEKLGEHNWTLLVQAVDLADPDVADLKNYFKFLPSWRIDDVMVSFASTGGGVGPHYDQYDVFLIQGKGSRRWQIGERCNSTTPLRNNTEMRLLENFVSRREVVLEPGDILYLPPRIAHHGTALQDSLCYSVGFRAPSFAELLQGFCDEMTTTMSEDLRFEDSDSFDQVGGGALDKYSIQNVFDKLRNITDQSSLLLDFFGKSVTEPRYPERIQAEINSPDTAALQALDQNSEILMVFHKNPNSRFAYLTNKEGHVLFVDGEKYLCQTDQMPLLKLLCNGFWPEQPELKGLLRSERDYALIASLIAQGSLSIESN